MFKLEDHHLEAAQQIAKEHRRKKNCDVCYERGWIGVSEQNLLILCTRCVDMDAAMEAWKAYVSSHEELKEHFSELFEEKPVEEAAEETVLVAPSHEHQKANPRMQKGFTPGNRRQGHTKKIG
ncbi:MAG: hypothetical protein RBS43_05630 [Candidatus Cloacimonas sp.]|jgi:hypothetical protein|nr:hypothetical protein [Candidatus Cloacimonas sp.]